MHLRRPLLLLLTSWSLASAGAAQDAAGAGYELAVLPYPTAGLVATLADEDYLVYDGNTVARFDASGTLEQTLTTFAAIVGPTFLEVAPDESFAMLGDLGGNLYRVDLTTGARSTIANLPDHLDAVFMDASTLVVSTDEGPFTLIARVHAVDLNSASISLLAVLGGTAGPLATDDSGNLFYATTEVTLFPPPQATEVLRFDAVQIAGALAGGAPLTEGDATVIGAGFDNASSLACDARTGDVFLVENIFTSIALTPTKRVFRVGSTRAVSEVVFEGAQPFALGSLEFVAGDANAAFAPYQPESAGELRLVRRDVFFQMDERFRVRPDRPRVTLSGPGAAGAGAGAVDLAAAPPGGLALFVFGVPSLLSPVEVPYALGGAPILSAIDPFTAVLGPLVPVSANGSAQLPFFNDGTLSGSAAIQAICIDSVLGLVGSSTTALL